LNYVFCFPVYLSPTKFCDELGFGEDLKTFNFEALKGIKTFIQVKNFLNILW